MLAVPALNSSSQYIEAYRIIWMFSSGVQLYNCCTSIVFVCLHFFLNYYFSISPFLTSFQTCIFCPFRSNFIKKRGLMYLEKHHISAESFM